MRGRTRIGKFTTCGERNPKKVTRTQPTKKDLKMQNPILHSDQGWLYQMVGYQAILRENSIQQNMSRKGNYLDNNAMENFFGRLKTECYYDKRFETFKQLKKQLMSIFIITTMITFRGN